MLSGKLTVYDKGLFLHSFHLKNSILSVPVFPLLKIYHFIYYHKFCTKISVIIVAEKIFMTLFDIFVAFNENSKLIKFCLSTSILSFYMKDINLLPVIYMPLFLPRFSYSF